MNQLNNHQAAKIAEDWCVREFGMIKSNPNQKGHDGIFPDGRKVEIKSKKFGAHSDSQAYVDLSESKLKGKDAADCLCVVFVDYETGEVMDHILRNMTQVRNISRTRVAHRIKISDLKKIDNDVIKLA